jgi:hypothetical protein
MKSWITYKESSNVKESGTKWFKCNQIYL